MRTPYDASVEHVADLDQTERDARATAASTLLGPLAERGVVGVATTFVDNSGVARVKAVPLGRLPHLAAWGVGSSVSFDRFRFDDWIAGDGAGREAVGDLRVMPDVRRVVPLGGTSGWAWAPADRYQQDGTPHDQCGRLLLASLLGTLAAQGITMKAAVELEWVVSHDVGDDSDDDFRPAARGPAYGMARLVDASDYSADLLAALADSGVVVEQFHPEYAPGQLELSVAAEDPVSAADTSVLVRSVIAAVGAAARLPHVVLAEGRRAGRRQRRARAPLAVARRREPDGRWPRRPLRADRRRRGVRRRGPRAPAGPDGGRRARRHVVPPARALALGGDVRLLGAGEPRGGHAHGHRVTRGDGVGRQRRGQVLRPPRQPVPGVRGPRRRRPLRPGRRFVAARPGRRRPGRARPPTSSRRAGSSGSRSPCARRWTPSRPTRRCSTPSVPGLSASVVAVRESELELFDGESDETVAAATRWQRSDRDSAYAGS